MRILHVISSFRQAAGGPVLALKETVARLRDLGAEPEVLCCDADPPDGDGAVQRVKTHVAKAGLPGLVGRTKRDIAEHVAGADIVHVHGVWDPLLIIAARAARGLGKPVVCTPHGMLSDWAIGQNRLRKAVYHAAFTGPMLKRASAIHFITAAEQRLAAKRAPGGVRQFVVPIFPAEEFYREPPSRDEALKYFPQVAADGPWVLFLSRIHPGKGLPQVIAAFSGVLRENPSAQLIIAGSGDAGYVTRMKRLVAQAGVTRSAHFVGMVGGPAKVALYRRAALLAVPSSHENFGMVFAESLACGTPVLLTPEVGTAGEIVGAGAGFLTGTDEASVARDLAAALRDKARLEEMGAAGRRWVLDYLRPERIAAQMLRNYDALLDGQASGPSQGRG